MGLRDGRRRGQPIICLGASTGGIAALEQVLTGFPANCPPTLVVQHILPSFSARFSCRLNHACRPEVLEAEDELPVTPGRIVIAPGHDCHLEVVNAPGPVCRLNPTPPEGGHRPSVDVLFASAAKLARPVVAAVLTGMGADGARGLRAIRDAGGRTIAQDEATSIVFGMPRAAIAAGAAEFVLPIDRICRELLRLADPDGIQAAEH